MTLLLNAARTFALVSFSDGKLAPEESLRFAKIAANDPALNHSADADISAAWEQAAQEIDSAQSFGAALIAIRSGVKDDSDKEVIMRVAQTAIVADGKLEPQENKAIRTLAEALGLDPAKY